MSKIQYTTLAPNLQISKVLTGLWQIADMERDGQVLDLEQTAQAMKPYVEAGFTTFDMADHYGSAEEIVGIFHKKYADEHAVQLFTKWVPSPEANSKQEVRAAVQRSLERMQLECIDLLQFHAWNYADARWLDLLFWLRELQEEGLIKHLGLTNFDTIHLHLVLESGIPIVSNQICYSLLDQRAANQMSELCLKYGVKILAFGTLAGGFFSEKWLQQPEPEMNRLATWSQMKYKRFIDTAGGWTKFQKLLNTLHDIAIQNQVSIANIASRFIMEEPAVGGIILGTRLGRSEHIKENEKLFEFSLNPKHKTKINEILQTFNPIPGDCGDEYRKPPFLTASGDLSHHLNQMPPPYEAKIISDKKSSVFSGTVWEDMAGYCRALRKGNRILVSGTTATHGTKVIGGKDPAAQTHFIIDKIEGAIQSLGGKLEDVVRTRIFIKNLSDWEPIARAHGLRFQYIQPANTLVKADLIGEEYLVEIEAEAIIE